MFMYIYIYIYICIYIGLTLTIRVRVNLELPSDRRMYRYILMHTISASSMYIYKDNIYSLFSHFELARDRNC